MSSEPDAVNLVASFALLLAFIPFHIITIHTLNNNNNNTKFQIVTEQKESELMADKAAIRVFATAAVLATLALAFGFIAFATRIKDEDVRISSDGYCMYPNSAAFGLGIVAAVFLLAEQIVISTGTGCFCCGGSRCHSTCGSITAVVLFVCSWLTFVIAFMGLLSSAIINSGSFLANAYHGKKNGDTDFDCYNFGRSNNLFLGAAIWSVISIVLGLVSYYTFKRSAAGNRNIQTGGNLTNEQGIAMGQPSTQAK